MPIAGDEFPEPTTTVRFSYTVELIMAATLATNRPSSLSGFDEDWQRKQVSLLPAASAAFLERSRSFSCPTLSIVDFVAKSGEFDDLDRLFAGIRAESPEDFLFILLNADLPRSVVASCLKNPPSAAAEVGRLTYFSRMPAADLAALFADPVAFREELLGFIASNRTPLFEARVREMEARYAARSAEIEARLAKKSPLAVAEDLKKRTFPRHSYRRYTFVPSYFEGYMNITSVSDGNFLFIFNVFPNSGGANAQAIGIAEQLRVLSDRSRLEILRILASGPSYGKEIAVRLDLTTATVSRHLDQLKSAGLVLEDKADAQNVKLVRIDRAAVESLLDSSRQFLFGCGRDESVC